MPGVDVMAGVEQAVDEPLERIVTEVRVGEGEVGVDEVARFVGEEGGDEEEEGGDAAVLALGAEGEELREGEGGQERWTLTGRAEIARVCVRRGRVARGCVGFGGWRIQLWCSS